MEGSWEKESEAVRVEGDGQGEDNNKEERELGAELAVDPVQTGARVHREHALRFPRSRKLVPSDGLPRWRRSSVLYKSPLQFYLGTDKLFSIKTEFIVRCMMEGLKYLHENNIIHRDIKPENIILDKQGYFRITDMGVARYWKAENSHETSGTPGYMAPEVLLRQNHSFCVDYFAIGVIAY